VYERETKALVIPNLG